jgi:hypothetical protein
MPADIPPMTPERWLANLLEVSREISNQEKQESRWTAPDRYAWESPDEMLCWLFDDCVFELFLEQYVHTFSPKQTEAIFAFRDAMNRWNEANPGVTDPVKALHDPDWTIARSTARSFDLAFSGEWLPSALI